MLSREIDLSSESLQHSVHNDPRTYSIIHDGSRCPEMDIRTEVENKRLAPLGWVVDGNVDKQKFWDRISPRAVAIPLKPQSGFTPGALRAQTALKRMKNEYGDDLLMVMVADDESFEGWSVRPVDLSDLDQAYQDDPSSLLKESIKLFLTESSMASEMKRHAYMLLTGAIDTK